MPESNTLKRATFNRLFSTLTLYADLKGIRFICTSYTRTAEEQKKLFDAGKSKCDGTEKISMHQKDRARDIAVIDGEGNIAWDGPEYETLGKFWESLGGIFGGHWASFVDRYHFEA